MPWPHSVAHRSGAWQIADCLLLALAPLPGLGGLAAHHRGGLHRSAQASAARGPLRPGGGAEILIAPTGLVDCANRRVHSSGVSFPAILHRSSPSPLSRQPEQLVLFLRRDRGRWQLTSAGTYDSVSRLGAIRQAIPRPPAAAAPSR